MQNFNNKVAVITGGASGIGYALAEHSLRKGMRVVIADIEQGTLADAKSELGKLGEVLAVVTDVSDAQQMDELAEQTLSHFGAVHFLANNAGVGGDGKLWELSAEDWEWTLGVNLWGVIHGIRVFAKHMVEQNEGHIVNTASVAGLMSAPGVGPYTVSKHAVVALSECLYGELRNAEKNVGVSVLCPSFVKTRIYAAHRNRDLANVSAAKRTELEAIEDIGEQIFSNAMPAEQVAEKVFDAIEGSKFYVLSHEKGTKEQVKIRMDQILNDGAPTTRGPEDYPVE